ncbi:MAG: ArsR/SmtB family transcription factor [Halanaeroarchaeum sp.]
MASYIPKLRQSSPRPDTEPGVFALDDEEVEDVLETLASETRRDILLALYDAPATPAELTAESDSSLQNVHYHLEKLREADLVEPIDTRYSEKGTEMSVLAPTNDPLIFVESEETRSWLRSMLPSFVGATALLALVGVAVQWLAERLRQPAVGVRTATYNVTLDASSSKAVARPLGEQLTSLLLEPGVLVFVGGMIAIVVVLLAGVYANR